MGDLYRNALKPYAEELPIPIQEAVVDVAKFFQVEELEILAYDDFHIAIPLEFTVPIPPMGTVNNIDIRPKEPVLLKIALKNYPYDMPIVMSGRKDFPRHLLPHLYVSVKGTPGRLCLVRNNPNEWFANKTIADLLIVTGQWFYKAAIGRLADDGEEFDPIRLEGYFGRNIYKYSMLNQVVCEKSEFVKGLPFSVLFGYVYNDDQHADGLTYRTLSSIQYIQKDEILKGIFRAKEESTRASPVLSVVVWRNDEVVEHGYSIELPATYGELIDFFSERGIEIERIISVYKQAGFHLRNGIPVIYAMKRPKKVVGCDGQYEFVNFVITATDFTKEPYPASAHVSFQSHIEPFSKDLATKVSGEERSLRTLVVGAGSLGSKLIVHEARSGNVNIGAVDEDHLLEHNLVRHALFRDRVGSNKADAIIKVVSDLFETDAQSGLTSYPKRLHTLPENTWRLYDRIIDTTASIDTLNFLAQRSFPTDIIIARGEIADGGRLGLIYVEGEQRNPRMDDLVNQAYYNAVSNTALQNWRKRDAEREVTNLNVGLGCSSTTSLMADDTISFHAAAMSRVLKGYNNAVRKQGLIYTSVLENDGIPGFKSEYQLVNQFDVYQCAQGSGWEVRMSSGIDSRLLGLCHSKGDVETGGVLVGMANYKTKTIHVFDVIAEPAGSSGSYSGFVRGNKVLPAQIDEIKEKTGDVIGYIGEWHSHPMNLEALSHRDLETIDELIELNRETPIPTCALIVTKEKILPFIFE